jgi:hypothetical protein
MITLISGYCREKIHSTIQFSTKKQIPGSRRFEVYIAKELIDQFILAENLNPHEQRLVSPVYFAGLSFYQHLQRQGMQRIQYMRLLNPDRRVYYFFFTENERDEILRQLHETALSGHAPISEGTASSHYEERNQSIHILFDKSEDWKAGRDDVVPLLSL